MSRPPILFPLFAELETLPGIGPKAAKASQAPATVPPPRPAARR